MRRFLVILILTTVLGAGPFAPGVQAESARPDVRVIVLAEGRVDGPVSEAALAGIVAGVGPIKIDHRFQTFPGFSATVTPAGLDALAAAPGVIAVEVERRFQIDMATAREGMGVDRAVEAFAVDGDRDGNPLVGSPGDAVIAVLDTGIGSHPDIPESKVIARRDFVTGPDPRCVRSVLNRPAEDDHGHGTGVAAVAAGMGAVDPAERGVAPGAALVAVKVADCQGWVRETDVLLAIDWLITERDTLGVEVINMSFGAPAWNTEWDFMAWISQRAVASGITAVTTAGNLGPGRGTTHAPGTAADVIAVGAVSDPGDRDADELGIPLDPPGFALADFSSRGPTREGRLKPELVAPGVDIRMPKAGTSGYRVWSGTSFSSPFVAGVAALMVDAGAPRPSGVLCLCPEGAVPGSVEHPLRDALLGTAVDLGPGGPDIDFGYGLVDTAAALDGVADPVTPLGPTDFPPLHWVEGRIDGPAEVRTYHFDVAAGSPWPLAVTAFQEDPSAPGILGTDLDFQLFRVAPDGTRELADEASQPVEFALGPSRSSALGDLHARPGHYELRVTAERGSGWYGLQVSGVPAGEPVVATREPPVVPEWIVPSEDIDEAEARLQEVHDRLVEAIGAIAEAVLAAADQELEKLEAWVGEQLEGLPPA